MFTFFLEHLLLNVQYSPVGCLKIFLIVCCRWEGILSHFESLHSSWLWHAVVYVGRSRVASPTLNILTWWPSIVRFFLWRYLLNSISYMTNLTRLVSLMWSISCLGLMLSNIFYLYNFTSTIKNNQDGKYYRDQHTAVLDHWYLEIFDRSHCTMLAFDRWT